MASTTRRILIQIDRCTVEVLLTLRDGARLTALLREKLRRLHRACGGASQRRALKDTLTSGGSGALAFKQWPWGSFALRQTPEPSLRLEAFESLLERGGSRDE